MRVRVVKTGANIQVYVQEAFYDANPNPVVNWTDKNPPSWGIGGFGLAASHPVREVDFRDVTFDANYARGGAPI